MKEHNIANKNFEEIACWTSKDSGGPEGLVTYQNGLIFLVDQGTPDQVNPSDPLHPPEHLDT